MRSNKAKPKIMRLKRFRYPMPGYIKDALADNGLSVAYRDRPLYQQNDYIGWITRAKREGTRRKRLNQMLSELEKGGKYMGMVYRPKEKI